MFAYCNNNPVSRVDSSGKWAEWIDGVINVVGGALQAAVGGALTLTTGWSGIGAVVGTVLLVNGAATITQGIGQITNHVAEKEVLCYDNIIKATVQDIGQAIGGKIGSSIAGGIYDGIVIGSSLCAGNYFLNKLDQYMPQIVNSKLFSVNDGYGIKIGKSIEMFYKNPNAAGGPGGTIFSYKGVWGKFRIDWDPAHGFHTHPPGQ